MYELKEYLEKNFNLNTNIININNIYLINNIKYINIFFILLIILNIYLIYNYAKFKNINIVYILFIFYLLFITFKYLLIIIHYYSLKNKLKKIKINNLKKYKDLKFKTGDIIQCGIQWNKNNKILHKIKNIFFDEIFLDTFMIINFKNKNYCLFYTNECLGFKKSLKINDNIQITLLDDIFIQYNFININNFRLIKIKKEIHLDNIMNYILHLDKNKFKYCSNLLTIVKNENDMLKYKYLNSNGFILYFIYILKKIPLINFNNIHSDDFSFLPSISNNYYNEIIYFNYK